MAKFFKQKDANSDLPRRRQQRSSDSSETETSSSYRAAFHRNRTITGSSSRSISSTNELNAQMRSPRASAHHLAIARRRLLAYLAVVLAASAVLFIFVQQFVATEVVQVAGNQALTSEQMQPYKDSAERYFAMRPIQRFRFLLHTEDFLRSLQVDNPEIKTLHVDAGSSFGQALITITPREPIARWNTSNKRQFVDADGVVFTKNYFKDPRVEIRDNSGIETSGSTVVTSKRFLGFVGRVIGESDKAGYTVRTATIPSLTTRQVRITVKGVRPYFTFSVDRPPAEQVEDMTRIIRYLRKKGISARYVDVRVQGKAFYR